MIKKLLLTASTSFIAILLIANSAIAITTFDTGQTKQSTLDLNVISPSLQLIGNSNASNHFGCSCASCIQSTQTTTI